MFKRVVNQCRRVPLVAYATGFFVFGVAGTRPLVPLYSIDLGTSVEEVGVLVATFALIPLSLAMFLGKKMDQTGTRSILLVSVCSIPDDHISPRRSALFMARSVLRDIRDGK